MTNQAALAAALDRPLTPTKTELFRVREALEHCASTTTALLALIHCLKDLEATDAAGLLEDQLEAMAGLEVAAL